MSEPRRDPGQGPPSIEGASDIESTWERVFDELVDLSPREQQARLGELREEDRVLAERVAALLAADQVAGGDFLDPRHRPTPQTIAEPGAPGGELAAGARIGAWSIIRPIGRGGMGEVYLAERADGAFEQRAAIKVVRGGVHSEGMVRRFLRERQILAHLAHPNIARLLDGGTTPEGLPFFVLEYVDGEPLTRYCASRNLGLEQRLALFCTVCRAVDGAHRLLVVHRDLKPANVLVTEDGTVKLLDFGIAKQLAGDPSGVISSKQLEGVAMTPAYAAPEQILGEPVSVASDVYALGVMLFELLTGKLPHERTGRSVAALAKGLATEQVERPSATLRSAANEGSPKMRRWTKRVGGDLDAIALAALHRDPTQRYRSVAALAEDVERFLADEPVAARAGGMGYRFGRFVRRHRAAVSIAALGLLALVVALVVALVQARAARLQARRADLATARAERVKSFLVSIFRESDPYGSAGGEVTARELLQQGSERLEAELGGEPEVLVELVEEIAAIELNLGLLDPALQHAKRAVAMRGAMNPRDDGLLARAEVLQARVVRARGGIDEAAQAVEKALPRLRQAYGPESLEVAEAEAALGNVLHRQEDLERAADLLRHAVDVYARELGEDHEDTAGIEAELGIAYEQLQRYPEAEATYRRALASLERRLGAHHTRVAIASVQLASLLDRLGRAGEARPLFDRALAIQRERLGNHHEQVAETLFSYGILLLGAQDSKGADAAFREALQIFGRERFEGAHCLRYLGLSAALDERYAEAATLFSEAEQAYAKTLGPDDVQRHRALANLGFAHLRQGRTADALLELGAAVGALERLTGPESYELRLPLKQLGEAQTEGQPELAVKTLERVRALEEKLFGTIDHREVGGSDVLLARALLARKGAGDPAAARARLDEALGIFGRVSPEDLLRGQALLASGRLAIAEGNPTRARSELALAVQLLTKKRGAAHRETREAQALLAGLPAAV